MLKYGFLSFLAGIALATVFAPEIILWAVPAVIGGLSYFVRDRRVFLFSIIIMLLFGGGALCFLLADKNSSLESYIAQDVELTGYVDSDFDRKATGASFYFRILSVNGSQVDERTLIRTESWPEYALGVPLKVRGVIEQPWQGDGFDYRSYLKKNGVRTVLNEPAVEPVPVVSVPLWRRVGLEVRMRLTNIRDLMKEGVQASVPEPASAYVNGILLGVRDDLPSSLENAFARTGTTHVLAISGYNVAIVAQGFLLLCLRITERKKAVWIAIAGITAFALLTGAEASVVRAAIMGSLVLVAQAWGRNVNAMTLILVAAAGMVFVNPYLLRFDVGFQLSFVAVVGLIYLSPWFERAWRAPKMWRGAWQLATATGAANVATLPLILFHFGTLPIYSLPANLLILPVVPYAMAWGAGAGLVSLIVPAISGVVGIPAWALATWQLNVVELFARLPGAAVDLSMSFFAAVAAYGLLVVMYVFYGDRRSDDTAQ